MTRNHDFDGWQVLMGTGYTPSNAARTLTAAAEDRLERMLRRARPGVVIGVWSDPLVASADGWAGWYVEDALDRLLSPDGLTWDYAAYDNGDSDADIVIYNLEDW